MSAFVGIVLGYVVGVFLLVVLLASVLKLGWNGFATPVFDAHSLTFGQSVSAVLGLYAAGAAAGLSGRTGIKASMERKAE